MKIKKWKTLTSKVVFTHSRLTLLEDTVGLPNKKTLTYLRYAPVTTHSAAAIAINERGEILLQREYSYPPNEVMWQLPGGGIEAGETPLEAAVRELSEESGFIAKTCRSIGFFYTDNRRSNQKQYIFVCTDLSLKKLPEDDGEFIESSWFTEDALDKLIASGEVTNINMLAALSLWRHSR